MKGMLQLGVLSASLLMNSAGFAVNATSISSNAIPTGILNLGANLVSVAVQIHYPVVYVGHVFEGWYSSVRVCNSGPSTAFGVILPAIAIDVDIGILDAHGHTVGGLNAVHLDPGQCNTYTSGQVNDDLFTGIPTGLYQVVVTNNTFLGLSFSTLDGTVVSTGRRVLTTAQENQLTQWGIEAGLKAQEVKAS